MVGGKGRRQIRKSSKGGPVRGEGEDGARDENPCFGLCMFTCKEEEN